MIVTARQARASKRSPWPVRDLRIFFEHGEPHGATALDLSETGAKLVAHIDVQHVRLGEVCRLVGGSGPDEFSVRCLIVRRGEAPAGMSGVAIGVEFLLDVPTLR